MKQKERKKERNGEGGMDKINVEPFISFSTKTVSALVEGLWLDALILC